MTFPCFKKILHNFFQCWSCEWYQKLLSRLSQSNSSCFYLVSWSSSISFWFQENFQSFIIINWMSFKILLLNNKLPFDWIWQEFRRQLTKLTNARIPNWRKSISLPRTACELSVQFLQNLIKMVIAIIKIIEKVSYHWKLGKNFENSPFWRIQAMFS